MQQEPLKERKEISEMAKTAGSEEVEVLRFFEAGPLEKVEPVFNIVVAKMRERLQREGRADHLPQVAQGGRRKVVKQSKDVPQKEEQKNESIA
jgi:hypothetical protein